MMADHFMEKSGKTTSRPSLEEGGSGHELIIERAKKEDAAELMNAAIRAFDDDNRYKPSGVCMDGPPGHDMVEAHEKWIESRIYHKALFRNRIIAGCCLVKIEDHHLYIHGFFVDPEFQNRGWGKKILAYLFEKYPGVEKWSLETPAYARRNHHFYETAGFTRAGMTKFEADLGWAFVLYERTVHNG